MTLPSHGRGRRFESGQAQLISHQSDQDSSYVKEFDAVVKSIEDRLVVLDHSYFYPTGGGQPGDTGVLKRINTIDNRGTVNRREIDKKEFKVVGTKRGEKGVVHEVDEDGLAPGEEVHAVIDWQRRYRLMRSHTAAHLVSALINKETGALITGNQLNVDKIRIDFSLERFDPELFVRIIDEANRLIDKDADVKISTITRQEALEEPSLAKLAKGLPEGVKELQVVEIEGIDRQACGGTHVKKISEIKRLTLLKTENKGKKNRRVYFSLE